eukprot:351963-Chlamydomonas_euryale.AAC.2
MKDMPVLSIARQRGSSSGLGVVTKGTPLRTVLSHSIQNPSCQPGRENQVQSHVEHGCRPRHPTHQAPSYVAKACESRCIEVVHQRGHPRRCAHLSRQVQSAVRPPAHAGDPAQVGVGGADERLQLLVCEAAGLRYSVEKGRGDVDAVQHGPHAHAAQAPQRWQLVIEGLPCSRKASMQVEVL